MSQSAGGNPISWRRLMSLRPVGGDIFESIELAWPPGDGSRAFGGHVYAQAAYAASKTVASGMVIHNVTGHFILPGRVDIPFTYRVRRVRDGGTYCLRNVEVYQAEVPPDTMSGQVAGAPCFVATVSFKRSETSSTKWRPYEHQELSSDHIRRTYSSVLAGKDNSEHPLSPGADALYFEGRNPTNWTESAKRFPGVESRKVDMKKYNHVAVEGGGGKAGSWRQLCFYRIILDDVGNDADVKEINGAVVSGSRRQSELDEERDLNLHACAHLYASDRNSLFLIQRAMGYEKEVAKMGSLSHTVIFHGASEWLRMVDGDGQPTWFIQEARMSNSGANRGCHVSNLWDSKGRIVGTTVQDGMIRIPAKRAPTAAAEAATSSRVTSLAKKVTAEKL